MKNRWEFREDIIFYNIQNLCYLLTTDSQQRCINTHYFLKRFANNKNYTYNKQWELYAVL